jgi:hypothetical protein
MARTGGALVAGVERSEGKARQARSDRIALAHRMAADEAGILQLAKHAMHRLRAELQPCRQFRQADRFAAGRTTASSTASAFSSVDNRFVVFVIGIIS